MFVMVAVVNVSSSVMSHDTQILLRKTRIVRYCRIKLLLDNIGNNDAYTNLNFKLYVTCTYGFLIETFVANPSTRYR